MEVGARTHGVPRWAATALLVVVGAFALAGGWYLAGRTAERPASTVTGGGGKDAAALLAVGLPDLEGRTQTLSQWRGKVLVVNFWATWCAPCREEMPAFIKAQSERGSQGLQFVGIAVDDAAKVAPFVQEIGLNYPALIGGYGALELSKTLGNSVMALPFTVIVSRDGKLVYTHLGPVKPEELDRIVAQLL